MHDPTSHAPFSTHDLVVTHIRKSVQINSSFKKRACSKWINSVLRPWHPTVYV